VFPIFPDGLLTNTPEGYYLIANTAFPRGAEQVSMHIRAPIKSRDRLPDNPEERLNLDAVNRQILSCRQAAEWGMRALQGSFGRLQLPLPAENQGQRADLIEICIRLYNLRVRTVGINQIKNVYEPIWTDGDQAQIWDGFEDMLFGEQRRRDRVSRFHLVTDHTYE
jgi:hypothetical protein